MVIETSYWLGSLAKIIKVLGSKAVKSNNRTLEVENNVSETMHASFKRSRKMAKFKAKMYINGNL